MTIQKRVAKLESGQPDDELVVSGYAPATWPESKRIAAIKALADEQGIEQPYRISLQDGPEPRILYAFTGRQLGDLLKKIAANGRRITDPPLQTNEVEQ
ncbi:MAG: hypothetical protein AAF674_15640 [Pseudomonadota bacterium]